MILVDTSIWIDHLRGTDSQLAELLRLGQVLVHPFVTGEISLGSIRQRQTVIQLLGFQRQAPLASHAEVMSLIEQERLHGLGIGLVDVHLLASARSSGAMLWTRDKRLDAIAARLGTRAQI